MEFRTLKFMYLTSTPTLAFFKQSRLESENMEDALSQSGGTIHGIGLHPLFQSLGLKPRPSSIKARHGQWPRRIGTVTRLRNGNMPDSLVNR